MPSAVLINRSDLYCAVLPGTRCQLSDHDFTGRFVVIASENVSTRRFGGASLPRNVQL
jgi:hypothetical protein